MFLYIETVSNSFKKLKLNKRFVKYLPALLLKKSDYITFLKYTKFFIRLWANGGGVSLGPKYFAAARKLRDSSNIV